MRLFDRLRTLRAFRKEHPDLLGMQLDRQLIGEIGYCQSKGKPLTLKQLFLLDIGSISTVQRRLRRLKELKLVRHRPADDDARAVELTLSPKCMRVYAEYGGLMNETAGAGAKGEPRHVCGLCDSDAGRRNLLAAHLGKALQRGDRCVLIAPIAVQNEILDELPHRRRAQEKLHVSQGQDSSDAQLAFIATHAREARQAGQTLTLAGEMSWTLAHRMRFDDLLAFEARLDKIARKHNLAVLCVYDSRHFSGSDFLHALKCHRDNLRHPVLLG